jgi:hypothetical protein
MLTTFVSIFTGYTQKSGAVSIVNTIETAPFFCVCPVYTHMQIVHCTFTVYIKIRCVTKSQFSPSNAVLCVQRAVAVMCEVKRPLGFHEVEAPRISRQSAHEGNTPGTNFDDI